MSRSGEVAGKGRVNYEAMVGQEIMGVTEQH